MRIATLDPGAGFRGTDYAGGVEADDGVLELLAYHVEGRDPRLLGHGLDPFDESERERDHPLALGLYVRGFVHLHRATAERRWLDAAREAAGRLVELAPGRARAWGLGFPWRGQPAEGPYTITTVICGLGLLELAEADDAWSVEADRVAKWLLHEAPWSSVRGGMAPWYGPRMRWALPNVTSAAAGFLRRWASASGDAEGARCAELATGAVASAQQPEGFWTYGYADNPSRGPVRLADTIDALHSSYTIDGVLPFAAAGESQALDRTRRGTEFLVRHLAGDGRLREKVALVRDDDPRGERLPLYEQLSSIELRPDRHLALFPDESRLAGYGAAIGMLSRATPLGAGDPNALARLVRRALEAYARGPNGRFRYLPTDARPFPRQEAHLFEGLAAAVLAARGSVRPGCRT
jgi:hypothetical protein